MTFSLRCRFVHLINGSILKSGVDTLNCPKELWLYKATMFWEFDRFNFNEARITQTIRVCGRNRVIVILISVIFIIMELILLSFLPGSSDRIINLRQKWKKTFRIKKSPQVRLYSQWLIKDFAWTKLKFSMKYCITETYPKLPNF